MIIELYYNNGFQRRKFIEVNSDEFAKIRKLDRKRCLSDSVEGQDFLKELQKRPGIDIPIVI